MIAMVNRTWYGMAAAALLLVFGAAGCSGKASAEGQRKPRARGPVAISAAAAVVRSVPVEVRTVGTAEAAETVTIRSQVTGVLKEALFRKGQAIEADETGRLPVLFVIDPAPFEAARRQAEGTRNRDKALLLNAQQEAERERKLVEKKVSSQADLDKKVAEAEALKALVASDEAAVQTAALQVGYCTIRSPIAGRAGDLLLDPGNVVKANETPLVVIKKVTPIEVRFSVTQAELPGVVAARTAAEKQGRSLTVQATTGPEQGTPEEGKVTFIDNTLDKNTGTILVIGTFENTAGRLWPGQFLRVNMTLERQDLTVVPTVAVQTGREGRYVFVVKEGKSVEMRKVTVTRVYDGYSAVTGVATGEQVATDGHMFLTDKALVKVGPAVASTGPASRTAGAPETKEARK